MNFMNFGHHTVILFYQKTSVKTKQNLTFYQPTKSQHKTTGLHTLSLCNNRINDLPQGE